MATVTGSLRDVSNYERLSRRATFRPKVAKEATVGEPLLSTDEVCRHLGITKATFYQQRTKGTGVRGVKVGRHLRFRQQDLDAWIEAHLDEPRVGAA
jgi:excisionase family DNA binding protein